MNRFAAILALGFGIFLALAELARNWGNWQWWPFWLVDFIAAALLIVGGVGVMRVAAHGRTLLAGAWGFTSAMFYMSFWSHIDTLGQVADGNLEKAPLTVIIGIMWGLTILGFVLSLLPAPSTDSA